MKNSLILFLAVLPAFILGQDPALGTIVLNPNPPTQGGSGETSVLFFNTGNVIPSNSGLTITITFLNQEPVDQTSGPIAGGIGDAFIWSYDNTFGNVYTGTQTTQIFDGDGSNITFPVNITGNQGETSGMQVNLQVPGSFVGNIEANDSNGNTAPIDNVLPVKLLYVKSDNHDCESTLFEWATSYEDNNDGFYIERKTLGSSKFDELGFVAGAKKPSTINRYSFIDKLEGDVNKSEIYYRLRQVDVDGKIDYSDIVKVVNIGCTSFEIDVYPNPARNFLNLSLIGIETDDKIKYSIINSEGAIVFSDSLQGNNQTKLKLDIFAPGLYRVLFTHKEETIVKSFLKIH